MSSSLSSSSMGSWSRKILSSWFLAACMAVPLFVFVLVLQRKACSSLFSSSYSSPVPLGIGVADGGGGGHDHPHLDFTKNSSKEVEEGHGVLGSIMASAPLTDPHPENTTFHPNVTNAPYLLSTKMSGLENGLARARLAIKDAVHNQSLPLMDRDYTPDGPIYHNAYSFHRSYLEMERLFKVHVYEEGEPPIFHDGPCRSIYSSEGRFIHNMEMESRLKTMDPELAHVHFLPYSVVKMVKHIYTKDSHNMGPLKKAVADYIDVIASKYPYWNQSQGADHFMLSCHDWGPYTSAASDQLYHNSIRVLCNANTTEGFNPAKDVTLPEINLKTDTSEKEVGGPSASNRSILAFFAGGNHGPVRSLLLERWKDKDKDVEVHEYLPNGVSYSDKLKNSRFCLCPSGYEVASPRTVEAIYAECVPVLISDHYVPPFSDVLNWKAFSVQISINDIPNIKKILMGISETQYISMQSRLKTVQKHFTVSTPPKRYDVYHMILHSVWLRRLNIRINPSR